MSSTTSELNSILYKAGAGAGKTTRLTEQFIQFSKQFKTERGHFPNVIVTTFTKKATQELRERLVILAQKENNQELLAYLQIKSMVHISTIHGVLSILLKKYGQEIGLSSDFTFISDLYEKKKIKTLIKDAFVESDKYSLLLEEYTFRELINGIQKYYRLKFTEEKLNRVVSSELIHQNKNYLQRFKNQLDEIAYQILESSTHDKWRLFAESALQLQWLSDEESLSDFFSRLAQFKEQFKGLRSPEKNPAVTDDIKQARADWNEATKKLINNFWFLTEDFIQQHENLTKVFEELAEKVCEQLLKYKLNQAEITMSDLELLSILLLERAPKAFQSFSSEWNYWMIDEYQDTSPLQVRLLNALVGTSPQFIVGDPQQSIYLFRGARSEVFEQRKQEFLQKQIPVAELMTNYRSEPAVLQFINLYFKKLSSQFSEMNIGRVSDPTDSTNFPAIEIIKVKTDSVIQSDSDQLNPSEELESTTDESEELQLMSPEIKTHMLSIISEVQKLIQEGVDPQSICLLSRDNNTLDQFAFFANQYRLPIQQHSGGSFFDRPEVKDALSVLQFLQNPHHNLNFLSILRSPWFHVDDSQIHASLTKESRSFWLELSNKLSSNDVVQYLAKQLALLNTRGLVETFTTILFERGLFLYAHRLDQSGRREANLWKVISIIHDIEKLSGDFSELQQAVEQAIDPEAQTQDSDATPVIEPQKISLMTIHASKGLQFDYVFMPMMHKNSRSVRLDGLCFHEDNGTWSLPVKHPEHSTAVMSMDAQLHRDKLIRREAEESERLLYVALTRAKKGIRLFWNEEFKGINNWASMFPLPNTYGEHQIDQVKYNIRHQLAEPDIWADDVIEEKIIRPYWQQPAINQGTLSISEILNQKNLQEIPPNIRLKTFEKARFGVEAHRVFEALKYNDFAELKTKINDENILQGIDYIMQLPDVPMMDLIRHGHVEWGFVIQRGKNKIQGQIDLWYSSADVDYIVDYKTGRKEYSDRALKQLEFYACCLNEMNKLKTKKIKLIVIYPLLKEVVIKEVENDQLQLSLDHFFNSGLEDLTGSKSLI